MERPLDMSVPVVRLMVSAAVLRRTIVAVERVWMMTRRSAAVFLEAVVVVIAIVVVVVGEFTLLAEAVEDRRLVVSVVSGVHDQSRGNRDGIEMRPG